MWKAITFPHVECHDILQEVHKLCLANKTMVLPSDDLNPTECIIYSSLACLYLFGRLGANLDLLAESSNGEIL